jgi:drug/metabolite transporter (DMT)-like permease
MLGMATGLITWVGCLVAACGLYLLGVDDQYQMGYGDLLQLAGASIWALHILAIDHFTKHAPGLLLACGQFVICAVLGILVSITLGNETTTVEQLVSAGPTLVYAGIITVGVAYTLQVIAQAKANPVHAGIILSLEAVFGAIGGYLILDEWLNARQLSGCGLMLLGMMLSQLASGESKAGEAPGR